MEAVKTAGREAAFHDKTWECNIGTIRPMIPMSMDSYIAVRYARNKARYIAAKRLVKVGTEPLSSTFSSDSNALARIWLV
jgi:hypothetical protein